MKRGLYDTEDTGAPEFEGREDWVQKGRITCKIFPEEECQIKQN